MSLSRRDFLKIMGGTTAAFAFPSLVLQGCKKALEKAAERTQVIWIQAQSCSGCSVSLLNKMDPDIVSVITEYISLNYHQTVMAGTGHTAISVLEEAVKKNRKDFVLIVEGSIPTKDDTYCTIGEMDGRIIGAREWIERLGENAKALVAVGTCATFGGIPGGEPRDGSGNPTGAVGLAQIMKGKTVLNVPGCPPHPDWMVGTLLHVLLKGMPKLDEYNRPLMYYGTTVHEKCERLSYYKSGIFAKHWGDEGCLYEVGCLGMDSCCDIPSRKWLGGVNSCTGCGAGCIGCTEDVFPDFGRRGVFKHLTAKNEKLIRQEHRAPFFNYRNGGVVHG
ncbi:MAG: hydrogenase small subunit [Spirochaetes bacterium]|nr:hydrogenase small subunit [Spirochaetota bacterium]